MTGRWVDTGALYRYVLDDRDICGRCGQWGPVPCPCREPGAADVTATPLGGSGD